MPAGTWTLTATARTKLLDGTFNIGPDTFKMALFTSTSNLGAASTAYAGVTNEVANGAGYTTGGAAVALALSGTTEVTISLTTAPSWTSSGSSITARYAGIYKVGGDVLAYCLLDATPADVVASAGNSFTVGSDGETVGTFS